MSMNKQEPYFENEKFESSGQLVEKAWQIDLRRINQGFRYSAAITYADTKNLAKMQLLKKHGDDMDLLFHYGRSGLTYLTIPVIRCKDADKYNFGGEIMTIPQMAEKQKEKDRIAALDLMLADKEIVYCYIIKHGKYYLPNSCGYTEQRTKAGVYPKKEAIDHARSVRELTAVPISIPEHNTMIQEAIDDLQTRLLK